MSAKEVVMSRRISATLVAFAFVAMSTVVAVAPASAGKYPPVTVPPHPVPNGCENNRTFTLLDYDTSAYLLTRAQRIEVAQIATIIERCHTKLALVKGFTDSRGTLLFNLVLSSNRAHFVARELYLQLHPYARRHIALVKVGYGPRRPAATNATVNGRYHNRRVEISLFTTTA